MIQPITPFDMLSALTSAELAITGATTATIGRMHRISGTSADYTITLPAASGNTGKFIGFRVLGIAAASKLYTLDGNGSETIDGATARVLWAEETCILYCDGSNWFKVAGKSRPMACTMHLGADQTIPNSTVTVITVDTTDLDNTALMASTGNNRIVVKRAGLYSVTGVASFEDIATAAAVRAITQIQVSGSQVAFTEGYGAVGGFPSVPCCTNLSLAAAAYIQLGCYQNSGNNQAIAGGASLANGPAFLSAIEQPDW